MSTQTLVPYQYLDEARVKMMAERLLRVVERDPHYLPAFERLCQEMDADEPEHRLAVAESLINEVQKFLVAAVKSGYLRMVPNRLVDAAWHTLILDTRLYARLCQDMGGFVHHNPNPLTSGWDRPGVLESSLDWMRQLGLEPNEIIWGIASAEYCSDHEPEPDKPERCSSCSGGTKP